MGKLVDGHWHDQWYNSDTKGRFVRPDTQFRNQIVSGDLAGYHLYVSLACPWAHRTLIVRALYRLEQITVDVVNPYMADKGWTFECYPDATGDTVLDSDYLYQVYQRADPAYTGRVTVPVLWDKNSNTIVNNESREIIRMLTLAVAEKSEDINLAPATQIAEIDAMIDANYEPINNGVYKCGFATSQDAYEEAADALFHRLDELESLLGTRPYLCGEFLTEADICLYTTLVRFDPVYTVHFKCSRKRIRDYRNLSAYLKNLYKIEAFKSTTNMDHIRQHYYWSHTSINPTRIVAQMPEAD